MWTKWEPMSENGTGKVDCCDVISRRITGQNGLVHPQSRWLDWTDTDVSRDLVSNYNQTEKINNDGNDYKHNHTKIYWILNKSIKVISKQDYYWHVTTQKQIIVSASLCGLHTTWRTFHQCWKFVYLQLQPSSVCKQAKWRFTKRWLFSAVRNSTFV